MAHAHQRYDCVWHRPALTLSPPLHTSNDDHLEAVADLS